MSNDNPVEATAGDGATGARTGRRGWVAAIAVAAVAAGVVAYKELGARPGSSTSAGPTASASAGPARAAGGSVLLFADPSEAETTCGCGQIIRLVRGAGARGVAIREIAPGSDTALEREHRVTVAPTVLFLDASGREVARHEGEGREAIDAIRAGLDQLAVAGR